MPNKPKKKQKERATPNPAAKRPGTGSSDEPGMMGTTSQVTKKTKSKSSCVSSTRIANNDNNVRVKITQENLLHLLVAEDASQRRCLEGQPSSNRNYYGTVIHTTFTTPSGEALYTVKFDALPQDHQIVPRIQRSHLTVLSNEADEPEYDPVSSEAHSQVVVMEVVEVEPEKDESLLSPAEASFVEFVSLGADVLQSATCFRHKWGHGEGEFVEWSILKDTEHIEHDPLPTLPMAVDEYPKKNIPSWDADAANAPPDCDYNNIFFEHFFPSIQGHGKVMDEYLGDPRCEYYKTFLSHPKERFHDPTNEQDPDWKVRLCYTLLIAAATERHRGMDNLWKKGHCTSSRHNYPDYGQWISKNQFQMFIHAAPICWCNRGEYWYTAVADRNQRPWAMFVPVLTKVNGMRRDLIKTVLRLLEEEEDETVSGWRPPPKTSKLPSNNSITSKLGGRPNNNSNSKTVAPRKPVPLGTTYRNGRECITACLVVFQDGEQQPAEIQPAAANNNNNNNNKYANESSVLPGTPPLQSHAAEVLRQVEGAAVVKGGWVGGDARFGSVMTAVEVFRRFQVHSTWVIQGNTAFFPMHALHAVMVSRFGGGEQQQQQQRRRRRAGHWVVMKSEIAHVQLFAMAYAYSPNGVLYFLSTCGKTTPHPIKYRTHFEDEWGNVNVKEIDRPWIAHIMSDYLPLIDEHSNHHHHQQQKTAAAASTIGIAMADRGLLVSPSHDTTGNMCG